MFDKIFVGFSYTCTVASFFLINPHLCAATSLEYTVSNPKAIALTSLSKSRNHQEPQPPIKPVIGGSR